jgi:hypothetical protein
MPEPQYVDDPFGSDDSWKHAKTDMQRALLKAGKRRFFKTGERDRFHKLEKKMQVFSAGSDVFAGDKLLYIPTQFALEILTWAQEENTKAGLAKIQVPTIVNMIKDPDRISKWLRRRKNAEEDRSGYIMDDDGW